MTKIIRIDDEICIGDGSFTIIAGPCSIEDEKQMDNIGSLLSSLGVKILRGGAFKPRTDPKSFQGLGMEGFRILQELKSKYNLKIISEIMDPRDIEEAIEYIDIIQIGARNMQNYSLLKEIGRTNKPVMPAKTADSIIMFRIITVFI